MKKFHFTKKSLSLLPAPKKGYLEYADTGEKSLKVLITDKGTKTFYFRLTVQKRPFRFKIAAFDSGLSVQNVRRRAAKLRIRLEQAPFVFRGDRTVKELCDRYISDFARHEKLTWKEDQRDFQAFLSPWFSRRIADISKNDVLSLHQKITLKNGACRANRILAKVSALFSKALDWEWADVNPAAHIRRNKEYQRSRFLNSDELGRFFQSMRLEKASLFKSMIWIAILTGVRRDNIRCMQWKQIDFDARIWTIPRTKNGRPFVVCLTE